MANKSKSPIVPIFESAVIESDRQDGYWVETFHFSRDDKAPGVIVSGLVSGIVEFLDNPIALASHAREAAPDDSWTRYEVANFDSPVAVVAVDVTSNGLMDVLVCHDYGPFMLECDPKGGWITWLENPGRDNLKKNPKDASDNHWKQRKIGRWPAMHRIKTRYFTQRSYLEVIAASVVYGPHDKTTPIPIIRFQAPENVLESTEWPRAIIDDENFTVIHEVTKKKLKGPNGLDSLVVSSREGTTWLYFENGSWHRQLIGIGEPKEPRQSPTSESPGSGDHWGSGCVDVGGLGDDPFAYIATLDPFHGIAAGIYTKVGRGLQDTQWKKQILDVYGTPNQLQKTGDGPGHFIICADFDGDGDDEFLLSLFGPLDRDENGESIPPPSGPHPNKGIMYYKAIDASKGLFAKWRIANESSARIAIGNFGGKGNLDLVSISYNVARYYEEPNPVVTLHLNKTPKPAPPITESAIIPTVWDGEGLVYLALPSEASSSQSAPLIEVANYALAVEVHPPGTKIPIDTGEGIKVLYGGVADINGSRTPLGTSPFPTQVSTTSEDSSLSADAETGAILLRLTPVNDTEAGEWPSAAEVPVRTTFDTSELGLDFEPLAFKKVEDLWWGEPFKGLDFYNMSGFHFRFQHDKSQIAHLQFWTAGTGVDCGVHNHTDAIFQEIHICLSPGTGNGGMSRIKEEFEDTPPSEIPNLDESAFDHVPLPELYEHGGLWHRDSYDKPVRGKMNLVSYPWHKWQAGSGENVDAWLALEFNPDLQVP
ncbi:hypothetical protein B0H67DRAFT_256768 [Lasiosphaeris hirsuta]|uniref:Aldos-2-ulose dehydratase/isomerase (AUDH) Cupin domain-containing protein n=1 Tax=Lasiosphaeris hirsuta TaxID=260670 RepID=A0AA40AHQ8_9PEZI|nr:hypothetical protein B0H67DRAFT_256768 [Lasiosphaeris hirsuta]